MNSLRIAHALSVLLEQSLDGRRGARAAAGSPRRNAAPKPRSRTGHFARPAKPTRRRSVVADALGLENSVGRSRVLIAAVMPATRLLEVDEIEARQAVLALPAGEAQETRRA